MNPDQVHQPVMREEVLEMFRTQPLKVRRILDGTLGRGGHTEAFFETFPDIQVVGFDRDPEAIAFCREKFKVMESSGQFKAVNDDFRSLKKYDLGLFDGALFDLGVSSPQLDVAERGFSFLKDGPLDMRLDPNQDLTAAAIVNDWPENSLSDLFFKLGEVKHPGRVVRALVHDRKAKPFTRTLELAGLIERVERSGRGYQRKKIHPATPYFMALRIAVNGELENLDVFFRELPGRVQEGGRIAVISFHSLEDRIVKWAFRDLDKKEGLVLTKKVRTPSPSEITGNPRARSAKLRIFQKGGVL